MNRGSKLLDNICLILLLLFKVHLCFLFFLEIFVAICELFNKENKNWDLFSFTQIAFTKSLFVSHYSIAVLLQFLFSFIGRVFVHKWTSSLPERQLHPGWLSPRAHMSGELQIQQLPASYSRLYTIKCSHISSGDISHLRISNVYILPQNLMFFLSYFNDLKTKKVTKTRSKWMF